MRRILFSSVSLIVVFFAFGVTAARAADVEFNADTILSGDWDSFSTVTAKSGCAATTLDVQSAQIVLTVASGDSCTLEANAGTFSGGTLACSPAIQTTVTGPATATEITPQ